jgi:hypothetical protein
LNENLALVGAGVLLAVTGVFLRRLSNADLKRLETPEERSAAVLGGLRAMILVAAGVAAAVLGLVLVVAGLLRSW